MAKASKDVAVEKAEPAPARRDRWNPLASLHEEMDRLFEDFSSRWPMGPIVGRNGGRAPTGWGAGAPAVDIVDLDKEVQVRAELPGMDEKDIEVELSDDMLTIRGEKKEEREEGEKEGQYYLSERRYGSFERTLRLPESANLEKADARFGKGILTVTFPKTTEALKKPQKVKVKAE